MNILFLVESYYPKLSGVPVVVRYLAEGLQDHGHCVSVATRAVKGCPDEERINNVHVYRFDIWKTVLKSYAGDISEYKHFVLSFEADVVIFECSECVTTDVLLDDLDYIKGKKIFHSHGFQGLTLKPFKWNINLKYTLGNTYNWLRFQWYYKYMFKKAIGKFDEALCLSLIDSSKSWLDKYAKHVTVLQNAVDDIFCEPTRSIEYPLIQALDKPYLLSVATYSKQKNQIGIVREFFKVRTNAALVFIGPQVTEYYEMLQREVLKLSSQYGPRDVLLLYGVSRKMIPDIIGHASLYLVGSLFEEYSISLIEAMCKGVPFISTNVGNARILPGGVTVSNISDMHYEIDRLMTDSKSRSLLGSRGVEFVKTYCKREKAVGLLETIIENVVKV